jgi:hypothetical protein
MFVKRLLPALLLVSFVFVGSTRLAAQEGWLTYAVFSVLDVEGRLQGFLQATPENRAELMRTQLQLWRTAVWLTLSPEQLAQLDENVAFITPALYQEPPDPALQAQADDLAARTRALFSQEDWAKCLWIIGDGWTK